MTVYAKALLWAAIIIAVAFVMQANGVSDGASFGVIGGLSGAAWASLGTDTGCGRSCLK